MQTGIDLSAEIPFFFLFGRKIRKVSRSQTARDASELCHLQIPCSVLWSTQILLALTIDMIEHTVALRSLLYFLKGSASVFHGPPLLFFSPYS